MAKKKQTKKPTTKKSGNAKVQDQNQNKNQIRAIIFTAISLFFMVLVLIPEKNLGGFARFLNSVVFGLFGMFAYILPVACTYFSIKLAFKSKRNSKATILFSSAFCIFLATGFMIFKQALSTDVNYFRYIANGYIDGVENFFSGGVLGSLLSWPLSLLLGSPLDKITIVLLLVVTLMFATGTTLLRLGVFANKQKERLEVLHNETREWMEKRKEANGKETADKGADDEPVDFTEKLEQEPETDQKAKDEPKFNVDVSIDGMPDHPAVLDELYKEKEQADKAQKKIDKKINVAVDEPKPVAKPEKAPKKPRKPKTETNDYLFPPLELLSETKDADSSLVEAELKANCELLVNVLRSFGVEARVAGYSRGPSVTRYEIQPSVGVRISKITNLADDIALQLRASNVRIAPIPNKSLIGIEVPNTNSATIGMKSLLSANIFTSIKSNVATVLGKDVTGGLVTCDLAKMPHLLVAGTTGSGKSVCLNSMIMSILYRANPEEVKFIMIDPKAVEFPVFNPLPHMLVPVVTDCRKAAGALGWAVVEMERRYQELADKGVKNIGGYNELCKKDPELDPMPQIVIFIDEFADLMMVAGNEVETSVCRLAQKARAAGMHLVIATQRPSADIFTGLIKSNIPSRISLSVASATDSRIIIDMTGAETLLGRGDMLYLPIGAPKPMRVQGCYISEEEINKVVEFISKNCGETEYDESVIAGIERYASEEGGSSKGGGGFDDGGGSYDARINEAIDVVIESGMASTSLLQRKLRLGYARAARIVDEMEERGIVGPPNGSKPREVLITRQDWQTMQMNGTSDAGAVPTQTEQLSFDEMQSADAEDYEFDEQDYVQIESEPELDEYADFEDEAIELGEIETDEQTINESFDEEDVEEDGFVLGEDEIELYDEEPKQESKKSSEDGDNELDFIDEDFLSSI